MTLLNDNPEKTLRRAALVAAFVNLVAALVMLGFLRPGLDLNLDVVSRMDYIAGHGAIWIASWSLWILAALTLIFLMVNWGWHLNSLESGRARQPFVVFGVLVACLGMIPDTMAETLFIAVLLDLAAQAGSADTLLREQAISAFMMWENLATHFTGFLGNGFYSLGGLVLQIVSWRSGALPTLPRHFGFVVWISGLMLTLVTLLGWHGGVVVFTGLTMASFVFWSGILSLPAKRGDPVA